MMISLAGLVRQLESKTLVSAGPVLAALPTPVLVLDRGNLVCSVNPAAEQFFDAGSNVLVGQNLATRRRFEFTDASGLFMASQVGRTAFVKLTWRF